MRSGHPATGAVAVALGEVEATEPFVAFLDAPVLGIQTAVVLRPYSAAALGLATIRLSQFGLATGADDDPAHTMFEPRLDQPLSSSRRASGRRLGGRAEFRSGEISFSVRDQRMVVDGVPYSIRGLLDGFSMNGREVEVRAVAGSWRDGIVLFKGTAAGWRRGAGGSVVVDLRGLQDRLLTPLQPATYAGTGDLEGPEELKGKPKPISLGGPSVRVQPTLVIPGELLFQLHTDADGNGAPINRVVSVEIGGVTLNRSDAGTGGDFATVAALRAASAGSGGDDIEPGEFATCHAEGWFRLGATPGAAVTCTVEGGIFGGVWVRKPGALMRVAMQSYGARLTDAEVDSAAMAAVDTAAPYNLEMHAGPQSGMTAAGFLDRVVDSIEGAWGDTRSGRLTAFVIRRDASVSPALFLEDRHVAVDSFEQPELPRDVRPAVEEVTIGYGRNYLPTAEVAGSVTGDARVRAEQEWLTVIGTQTVEQHAEPQTLRIDTMIADAASAEAFRDAMLLLYDGRTRPVGWRSAIRALQARPGLTASLTLAEEGLSGERVLITGTVIDMANPSVGIAGLIFGVNTISGSGAPAVAAATVAAVGALNGPKFGSGAVTMAAAVAAGTGARAVAGVGGVTVGAVTGSGSGAVAGPPVLTYLDAEWTDGVSGTMSGPTGYTSGTLDFGAADANRWIMVIFYTFGLTGGITGVTIGGETATRLGTQIGSSGSLFDAYVASVPTGASGTVVITHATDTVYNLGAIALYRIDHTEGLTFVDNQHAVGDGLALSLDTAADDFVVQLLYFLDTNVATLVENGDFAEIVKDDDGPLGNPAQRMVVASMQTDVTGAMSGNITTPSNTIVLGQWALRRAT